MSLFIFNKEQKLIKLVPNKNIVSLVHEEIINKPDILLGEMRLSEWGDIREEPHYAAVRAEDGFNLHFFKVTNVIENINTIGIKGVSLAHDELQAYGYIKDRRFVDANPHNVLSAILDGTDWSINRFDIPPQKITINFYYVSRLKALNLLIEKLGAEVTFRVRFSGNSIQGKVVNVFKEISEFKGKRFALGTNLIDVVGEEDTSTIYTALIGRGKGETSVDEEGNETGGYGRRITFENLEWKKEYGDPLDKPFGQLYLENPQATELYGYADGTPRIGIVEFPDLEYPENVLRATYNELLQTSRPKKQFKAVVDKVGDMELGETVAIIKPGTDFRYMTRVFKVKRDHLDNSYTEVEFGDRLVKTLGETLKLTKEDVKDDIADDILDSSSDINQAIDSAVRDSIDGAIGEGGYPRDIVADSLKLEGPTPGLYSFLRTEEHGLEIGTDSLTVPKLNFTYGDGPASLDIDSNGQLRIVAPSVTIADFYNVVNEDEDAITLSLRSQSLGFMKGYTRRSYQPVIDVGEYTDDTPYISLLANEWATPRAQKRHDPNSAPYGSVSMEHYNHNQPSQNGIKFKFLSGKSNWGRDQYVYYLVTMGSGIFKGDEGEDGEITWTKVLE